MSEDLVLFAVGDVIIRRADPDSIFDLARPLLQNADIRFGNCEAVYSTKGSRNPVINVEVRSDPESVSALENAGFDVMTFANNCHLDCSYEGFFETLDLLHRHGIVTCGAGKDLTEAHQPAIVERNGTKVAFLGYSCVAPPGYDAGPARPGCAAITIYNHYVDVGSPGGRPPRSFTVPEPAHVEALRADIASARAEADVVVFTAHWGVMPTWDSEAGPAALADYETQLGRIAIDAGADLVLGHHQHILKGVQVYKGKVIFHGLGNFALDADMTQLMAESSFLEDPKRYVGAGMSHHPDYPTYPFHPDARRTMIVKCNIVDKALRQVSFLPCLINQLGQPEPLVAADERFHDVKRYVEDITAVVGLDTAFKEHDDEVVIEV
jgi:poly-gamma-glutamate synthesis protein (capsule biosynthesis protein)